VRDVTASTIPFDFARNPRIHACFEITRAAT
jgi:23S rRNA (guanine2445-N2)-methyltransferase / 23S rRNA (guanine2069-N7)-methyltransferase